MSRPGTPGVGSGGARPALAVVITCYDYRDFVGSAIRSVLDQGSGRCEVVVVDDGSSDDSWDVIRSFPVSAHRTENGGQRAACLYGLDRTTAPFVLFLDADDELRPGSIATILEHLDPDVAKLQFSLERIDRHGTVLKGADLLVRSFRGREAVARQVLESGAYVTPPTSGNVFRRDLCELLREADYDRAVDGVILFAAPFFGDVVSFATPLGRYRVHDRNDSGIGRLPERDRIGRDIDRFVARTEHLARILRRIGEAMEPIEPHRTIFVRLSNFHLDVASGRRPSLRSLIGLLGALGRGGGAPRTRAALACFYGVVACLPHAAASALIAYRLDVGRRTLGGLVRTLIRSGRDRTSASLAERGRPA